KTLNQSSLCSYQLSYGEDQLARKVITSNVDVILESYAAFYPGICTRKQTDPKSYTERKVESVTIQVPSPSDITAYYYVRSAILDFSPLRS
ncbi:hypothetical protein STEG23_032225, partial [Scotinomys teguina]